MSHNQTESGTAQHTNTNNAVNDQAGEAANLEKRAIRGLGWRFGSLAVGIVLQFGTGVALAWILPIDDFGLIGLGWIVIGFANLFASLGLGPALIQRESITIRQIRAAFTLSVLMSILLAAMLYLLAPFCAGILKDARVIPILKLLSVNFLFTGLGIVSNALLSRNLAFRRLFYVNTIPAILYAPASIGLAVAGFGVWSLVYSSLFTAGCGSLLAYFCVRHPVTPLIALREIKELSSFGVGISLASMFNYVALQGDYFIVGRSLGAGPLAVYTRAYSLMTAPTTHFIQALGSVLFPAASRIQHEPERFRNAYTYSLSVMGFIVTPISLVILIMAPEIILGIYGEKWKDVILPLQILSISGIFRALYNGQANFIRAKGWVYRILFYQITYAVCVLTSAWIGAVLAGLAGVAIGVTLSIFLVWGLVSQCANQATGTGSRILWSTLRPGFMVGLVGITACSLIKWCMTVIGCGPLFVLLVSLAGGGILSALAIIYLPQNVFMHLPERILRTFRDALPDGDNAPMEWLLQRVAQNKDTGFHHSSSSE